MFIRMARVKGVFMRAMLAHPPPSSYGTPAVFFIPLAALYHLAEIGGLFDASGACV